MKRRGQWVRGFIVAMALAMAWLVPGVSRAETAAVGSEGDEPGGEIAAPMVEEWRFLGGGGGRHQFKTSIDGGGDVSVSAARLGVGGRLRLRRDLSLKLQVGYEYASYDFSGSKGFAALNPWSDVHTVDLGSTLTAKFSDHWLGYAGLKLKGSAESGADFGNAITVGGLVGAAYRLSDRLTIGAGVAVSQRLEDSASVSPLLSVMWTITDGLTLRVGAVAEGGDGLGGVDLEWEVLPELELGLGATNQVRRFRLDDDGVAPKGVGRDRSTPIYVRAKWRIAPHIELSMMGGVAVGGELRLEDRHGDEVRDHDYDPTPFVSARLAIGF